MKITFLLPCCLAKFIEDLIMNRHKRRRMLVYSLIFGSFLLVLIMLAVREGLLASSFICSTSHIINHHINVLCAEVTQRTEQKLCRELCSKDVTSRITCHNLHLNKPAVFTIATTLGSSSSSKVVVKKAIDMAEREVALDGGHDEEQEVYWNRRFEAKDIPSKEDFQFLVTEHINNFIGGGEVREEVLGKLINYTYIYTTETETAKKHYYFGQLIQDHEFLTSVVFENLNLFPRVVGICGSYYAIEYFEPLSSNPMQPYDLSWRSRLWKALDILKYLRRLETEGREPLHLCDIKLDHFGWNERGGDTRKMAFLDLDDVMYENSLLRIMEDTPYCSTHEDCSYFDCKGRCHHRTNKCEVERSNTNLQVVCDKIFLGNSESLLSVYGLLVSAETTSELEEALHLCLTNRGMTVDSMIDVVSRASNALLF